MNKSSSKPHFNSGQKEEASPSKNMSSVLSKLRTTSFRNKIANEDSSDSEDEEIDLIKPENELKKPGFFTKMFDKFMNDGNDKFNYKNRKSNTGNKV